MPINLQLPPADLTPWNMFHSADIVVKSVIVHPAARLGRHLDHPAGQVA